MKHPTNRSAVGLALIPLALLVVSLRGQQPPPTPPRDDPFRFKSGVDLINVTATVSDANGRFVPGLTKDDFLVFEDDRPVEVTHFDAERVPVSLGIALDTSGSMAGEKIEAARAALNRFLVMLLDPEDEIFLYRFSNYPTLVQGWTSDRQPFLRALDRLTPNGGTAMYDAIVDAVPLVAKGQKRKKALLILSDGRDTSSSATVTEARRRIRESEALVYAIGIDCGSAETRHRQFNQQRGPIPMPFPFPPRGRGWPQRPPPLPPDRGNWMRSCSDPVDTEALRDLTDDSGGRTELSKQYYLGYPAVAAKDGRWHSIRVELRNNKTYRVRARRGYTAS